MSNVVERRSIDVVPEAERHGTPYSQFTLWFGANMQVTAVVDGAPVPRVGGSAALPAPRHAPHHRYR